MVGVKVRDRVRVRVGVWVPAGRGDEPLEDRAVGEACRRGEDCCLPLLARLDLVRVDGERAAQHLADASERAVELAQLARLGEARKGASTRILTRVDAAPTPALVEARLCTARVARRVDRAGKGVVRCAQVGRRRIIRGALGLC